MKSSVIGELSLRKMVSWHNTRSLMLILAFLVLGPYASYGGRSYSVEFESFRDESNPDYFRSNTLQLINYTTYKAISGCYVFSRDIKAFDYLITATAIEKRRKPWTWLNVTINGCAILGRGGNGPPNLVQLIYRAFRASSTKFPDKCPMKKDTDYCLDNFTLNFATLPPNVPQMKLNVLAQLRQKNVSVYKAYLVVAISGRK